MRKEYSIFTIAGKDGITHQAKINLEAKHSDANIVGTYVPSFGFEKNKKVLKKINTVISVIYPDILIVCFSCLKQEKWIYENYKKYAAIVFIRAEEKAAFLKEV